MNIQSLPPQQEARLTLLWERLLDNCSVIQKRYELGVVDHVKRDQLLDIEWQRYQTAAMEILQ